MPAIDNATFDKVEKYLEYMFIDGAHHKQYALVKIAKALLGDEYDEWIWKDAQNLLDDGHDIQYEDVYPEAGVSA